MIQELINLTYVHFDDRFYIKSYMGDEMRIEQIIKAGYIIDTTYWKGDNLMVIIHKLETK